MPNMIYNNVEDNRILFDGKIVEDVTSISLPTEEHPTTNFDNVSGTTGNIEMPNQYRVNAMELGISHNNGKNCDLLSTPGKHTIEVRLARQVFNVAKTNMGHEGVKFRFNVFHKSTENGTIENGNPLGSTDKFSVIRDEVIINGKQKKLIDIASGVMKINGTSYSDDVQNLLK